MMAKDFQLLFCILLCNLDVYNKMQLYHFTIYLQKMLKEINQVHATKKNCMLQRSGLEIWAVRIKSYKKNLKGVWNEWNWMSSETDGRSNMTPGYQNCITEGQRTQQHIRRQSAMRSKSYRISLGSYACISSFVHGNDNHYPAVLFWD